MSLGQLLKPVLPQFPGHVIPDNELEVLEDLPIETLYLALKEADHEVALWTFENAMPEQIQGICDLECWEGAEFLPDRFDQVFRLMSLVSPMKLAEHMRQLDPELIVRGLMSYFEVRDYDPEEPMDIPEEELLITPDFKYALKLLTKDPETKEMLFLWLNKMSAADIELLRRHIESCKWEQAVDLEEFGYKIKKGRLEDMGFVDYHEALAIYATGNAVEFREQLLENPLDKGLKGSFEVSKIEGDASAPVNESFLPEPLAKPLFGPGLLREAFNRVTDSKLREVLLLEIVRTVNTSLSADKLLHGTLEDISRASERARAYLDLGLAYLSGAQVEKAAEFLEVFRLADVLRLGWLSQQDLIRVASVIRQKFGASYFGPRDEAFLEALQGRHVVWPQEVLKDFGISTPQEAIRVGSILKFGAHLTALSQLGTLATQSLKVSLPSKHSCFALLTTQAFRMASGSTGSQTLTQSEWKERVRVFSPEKFSDVMSSYKKEIPQNLLPLFETRIREYELLTMEYLNANREKYPDKRFFKTLVLEE